MELQCAYFVKFSGFFAICMGKVGVPVITPLFRAFSHKSVRQVRGFGVGCKHLLRYSRKYLLHLRVESKSMFMEKVYYYFYKGGICHLLFT